jgi:hypothetical protein
MNGSVCGYGGVGDGLSFKAFLFAPDRIQVWEIDELNPFYFNDGSMYPYEGITSRHRNFPFSLERNLTTVGYGGVIGNFDGSAEVMSLGDFYKLSGSGLPPDGPTTPNRLWCNPGDPGGG